MRSRLIHVGLGGVVASVSLILLKGSFVLSVGTPTLCWACRL